MYEDISEELLAGPESNTQLPEEAVEAPTESGSTDLSVKSQTDLEMEQLL